MTSETQQPGLREWGRGGGEVRGGWERRMNKEMMKRMQKGREVEEQ